MNNIYIDDDGSLHEITPTNRHTQQNPYRPVVPANSIRHQNSSRMSELSAQKKYWCLSISGSICVAILTIIILSGVYSVIAPVCAVIGPIVFGCSYASDLNYSTKTVWLTILISLLCGFGSALVIRLLPYLLILLIAGLCL